MVIPKGIPGHWVVRLEELLAADVLEAGVSLGCLTATATMIAGERAFVVG